VERPQFGGRANTRICWETLKPVFLPGDQISFTDVEYANRRRVSRCRMWAWRTRSTTCIRCAGFRVWTSRSSRSPYATSITAPSSTKSPTSCGPTTTSFRPATKVRGSVRMSSTICTCQKLDYLHLSEVDGDAGGCRLDVRETCLGRGWQCGGADCDGRESDDQRCADAHWISLMVEA
jgi:hypothetical protein